MILQRHIGVEAHLDAAGGADGVGVAGSVVIEPAGTELALGIAMALQLIADAAVGAGTGLCGLDVLLRVELVPTLMRPTQSRWAPLCRSGNRATEEPLDYGVPGVAVQYVGILTGERKETWSGQECIQVASGRPTSKYIGRVLFRGRPQARLGKPDSWRRRRIQSLQAKRFETQHLLAEGLGAVQRTRPAVGGDVERCLLAWRQDVFSQGSSPIPFHSVSLFEGPLVRRRQALEDLPRVPGVLRLARIGGWILGWRLVRKGGVGRRCQLESQQDTDREAGLTQQESR
ncbi:hypothetical protein D9M68_524220 [compost metagenome]